MSVLRTDGSFADIVTVGRRSLVIEVIRGANSQGLSKPIREEYAEEMLQFTDTMGSYKPSMQIDRETMAIFGKPLQLPR
jgi:2-dehydropantoate 2-reductase